MFERARILCAALLLSTLLGGCGGGGSSSSTAVATADATGVWEGTITQNGVGTYNVTGLITGGQMRFISVDGNALYEGTVSVSGSTPPTTSSTAAAAASASPTTPSPPAARRSPPSPPTGSSPTASTA